jgi:NAD(P)-dependent dehydrogenase (short-subunit alcohol dehydrogenase family)
MGWTLITGGAKRLGAEICLGLAENGHSILVHYHDSAEEASEIVRQCRLRGTAAESIAGDFSTVASTEIFIEKCLNLFPSIQHLVNNVGEYLGKSALKTVTEEWLGLFQTNLHAPFMLTRAFVPTIKQQGSIVNIGMAGAGIIRANLDHTAYQITKMSLYMLTKSIAKELAPFNVPVNMISPGYLENSIHLPKNLPAFSMQRPGLLKEVVRVVLFLMEKESVYITGQNIEVSGGVAL